MEPGTLRRDTSGLSAVCLLPPKVRLRRCALTNTQNCVLTRNVIVLLRHHPRTLPPWQVDACTPTCTAPTLTVFCAAFPPAGPDRASSAFGRRGLYGYAARDPRWRALSQVVRQCKECGNPLRVGSPIAWRTREEEIEAAERGCVEGRPDGGGRGTS